MRQNNCDYESKTKLSKIDILTPVQNKIRPLQQSQRINASTFERSARFEPEENNPGNTGTAYLRVTKLISLGQSASGKSQFFPKM